jgi:23S rRNA pseudouridine955/2504/2580 synthase
VKHIIGDKEPGGTSPVQTLQVDEESAGQRLDNFLVRHLKGVPKTHVYRIIRSGEVRVNKGRAAADTRVAAGDAVRVPPIRLSERAEAKKERPAPPREFPILLEDEYLIALDKPAGVAVHGGSGVSFGVIEQLRQARPDAKFLELVHRLDRETSGILLVAKRRSALTRHLASQGHPIAGDDKYGDFSVNKALHKAGLARMFLHAWRLQFNHPATGERIELLAPLPPDLHAFAPHDAPAPV